MMRPQQKQQNSNQGNEQRNINQNDYLYKEQLQQEKMPLLQQINNNSNNMSMDPYNSQIQQQQMQPQNLFDQNNQDISVQYKYSLYDESSLQQNDVQQFIDSQVAQNSDSQIFDPQEYRYPSLHGTGTLYQKWENSQLIPSNDNNNQNNMVQNNQYQNRNQFNVGINQSILSTDNKSMVESSVVQINISSNHNSGQRLISVSNGSQLVQAHQIQTNEQRLKREMEEWQLRIQQQQAELKKAVMIQPKTVGIVPQQLQIQDQQQQVQQEGQLQVTSTFLHQVQPNDTLDRLCLIYGKSKEEIRKANEFDGDEIFFIKELKIPNCNGPMIIAQTTKYTEEQRRKDCLEIMNKTLMEKYRDQKSYLAEAQYYLEVTNYDLRKAFDEFDADLKFEKEQKRLERQNKKKSGGGGFLGLFKKKKTN
eukprot:403346940